MFYNPDTTNGVIRLAHNEPIELFCSDSFLSPFSGTQTLIATCQANNQFLVNGKSYAFQSINCTREVEHTARLSNNADNLCTGTLAHIEIGFEVHDRFLKVMDVCHDMELESTAYTFYPQYPENNGFQRSFPRPSFIPGNFFNGRNVDRLYFGFIQRQTISTIIGEEIVERLWDNDKDFFLARGHLAARSDFIFGSQQRATFYFMNAAPQWHSFNSGNWERIESGLKVFVANRNIYTDMYTGTFGIQQLADSNGVEHELFLDFDRNGNGLIPVPKYFYKIIIDKQSGRGLAFVGVNNPHATASDVTSGKYTLCTDISDQVTFINWNRERLSMGYSYACEVNELVSVLGHLPASVRATGLLL